MALINTVETNLSSLLTTIKDSSLITNARTQVNTATAEIDSVTRAQILVNFELTLAQNLTQSALQTALAIETANAQISLTNQQADKVLSDINISEEQSAKDLLVKAQQIVSMTKEDDVKIAQLGMIEQQILTEVQTTTKVTNEGNLISSQKLLIDQQKLTEVQKTTTETNQAANIAKDTDVKNYQLTTFLPKQVESMTIKDSLDEAQSLADVALKGSQKLMVDEQKNTEIKKQITETNQGDMLLAQASMIVAQAGEVAPNAAKQRDVQTAQINQVNRETNYTLAKTDVMLQSRLDNLVIETAKMQQQKVMGLGNGGITPAAEDFYNETALMQSLYHRAKEENMPNVTFAVSSGYKLAT